jgi:hypothetical protein
MIQRLLLILLLSTSLHAQEMGALYLNGADAHVELPPDLFAGLSDMTVEAWVKWD